MSVEQMIKESAVRQEQARQLQAADEKRREEVKKADAANRQRIAWDADKVLKSFVDFVLNKYQTPLKKLGYDLRHAMESDSRFHPIGGQCPIIVVRLYLQNGEMAGRLGDFNRPYEANHLLSLHVQTDDGSCDVLYTYFLQRREPQAPVMLETPGIKEVAQRADAIFERFIELALKREEAEG